MSDSELLTAVLTEAGWKYIAFNPNKPFTGMRKKGNKVMHNNGYHLLTSRDAVWEVLGLDKIEGGYWEVLNNVVFRSFSDIDTVDIYAAMKATCPQMLEAWLQWKKGGGK